MVKIDGIDNVTQYPNIEEDQEEVNVEDIEDFDEDDYYDEITNSQRQLKKLENNTTGGNNRLDSRHLQK